MKLRIKISPSSGERDKTFSTEYAGQRYSIGPKAIEVPDEAGRYLAKSFSNIIEVVPDEPISVKVSEEPAPVTTPIIPKPKSKKSRRRK